MNLKIKVISYYTNSYSDIGVVNSERWMKYCKLHDYQFFCPVICDVEEPFWEKIKFCIEEFNKDDFDFLVWSDIDICVVDFSKKLESMLTDKMMYISSDDCGLCAGFMIFKNCEWNSKFLQTIFFLRDVMESVEKVYSPTRKLKDQSCIKYLYEGFELINKNISLIDQSVISHPRVGISSKSFLHHFWWTNNNRKQELIDLIMSL